jgi:hypothetical protein
VVAVWVVVAQLLGLVGREQGVAVTVVGSRRWGSREEVEHQGLQLAPPAVRVVGRSHSLV